MTLNISKYKTLIFDCDGVILNSNQVKTNAFYNAALPYGKALAEKLVEYHVNHGGISRYAKFEYFLKNIIPSDILEKNTFDSQLKVLLTSYAQLVHQGLLECEVAPSLEELRDLTLDTRWLIVSGGDQAELNEIFSKRKLSHFFDGGIYGSPDTKDEILSREIKNGNIIEPALFLGDSKYDYQAATNAGLDFIFLSDWSEVGDWLYWVTENRLNFSKDIRSLIYTF